MIRIEVTDEKGERRVLEARGIDGGALVGEASETHKPIKALGFGDLTSSDRMSIIETMIARVAAEEIQKGADPAKLHAVFEYMVRNAFAAVVQQPERWATYKDESGAE